MNSDEEIIILDDLKDKLIILTLNEKNVKQSNSFSFYSNDKTYFQKLFRNMFHHLSRNDNLILQRHF